MEKHQIEKLIEIRNILFTAYGKLDRSSMDIAIMKQRDAALVYEGAIKKIDVLLGDYVTFK